MIFQAAISLLVTFKNENNNAIAYGKHCNIFKNTMLKNSDLFPFFYRF